MAITRLYSQQSSFTGKTVDLSKYGRIESIRVLLDMQKSQDTLPDEGVIRYDLDLTSTNGVLEFSTESALSSMNPIKEYFFRFNSERLSELSLSVGGNDGDAGALSYYIEIESTTLRLART